MIVQVKYCCLLKCYTLVSDEVKTKRKKTNITGQNGANANCSHGCVCREIAFYIRQNPHDRRVGEILALPWTKESAKESVAKMSAGALAYSTMTASMCTKTFTVRCGLLWCAGRRRTCSLTSEFNSLGEWYINEIHHNMARSWCLHSTERRCIIDASKFNPMIRTGDEFLYTASYGNSSAKRSPALHLYSTNGLDLSHLSDGMRWLLYGMCDI